MTDFGAQSHLLAVTSLLEDRVVDLVDRFQHELFFRKTHARQLRRVRDLDLVKRVLEITTEPGFQNIAFPNRAKDFKQSSKQQSDSS